MIIDYRLLPDNVLNIIKLIYENFTYKLRTVHWRKLLDEFVQNYKTKINNESLNDII